MIARLPATKQYADFSEMMCMIQFYYRHPGTRHCKPSVSLFLVSSFASFLSAAHWAYHKLREERRKGYT